MPASFSDATVPRKTLEDDRKAAEDAPVQPFVPNYLPYLLARASHLISAEFHSHLATKGVPVPVWRVLACLYDGDGVSIGRLADLTLHKQPTLTKVIDRLEEDGLVKRQAATGDRRQTLVFITDKGRDMVSGLVTDARVHEHTVTASYTTQEMATLKRVLRTLIQRLEDRKR